MKSHSPVAEIKEGKAIAYPDEAMNQTSLEGLAADDDAGAFVSVQSVVVDPADRLWILDNYWNNEAKEREQ